MSLVKTARLAIIILCITACTQSAKKHNPVSPAENNDEIILSNNESSGKNLSIKYCQLCHLYPEPALLDRNTWLKGVLPNMGWRMGIREKGIDPYAGMLPEEEKIVRKLNVYPDTPKIKKEEWEKIIAFYGKEAPGEPLAQKTTINIASGLPQFKTKLIRLGDKPLPQTTLLKFDKATSQLYVGDAQKVLYILNNKFQLNDSWVVESAPTDMDFPKKKDPRLLTIGIFPPSDQKIGRLASLDTASVLPENGVFIEFLPRPVQFTAADLNMDGKEDIVICGFGNHTGKLSWFDGGNPSKEHILTNLPGARRVEIFDFNNDKRPDIMVLMAQAYEKISIFYNQGEGKFIEKKLLGFPPVYGVSYFELADFNKDGFQDILLTNGDNWDLSPIRKNYHGIRIFLNDGKDNFKEAWFYPMYGTSKAVARDFDNDGDLDIAAISFYADLDKPERGFIYLSNEGGLNFKAYSTPEAAVGKWLTMDAGDFDRDGDVDIVLGSYFQSVGELSKLVAKGVLTFPQIMVLTNKKNNSALGNLSNPQPVSKKVETIQKN
ncbi:MAG: VCBS repeat-containing protein [Ferruginibacter sp.]